MCRNPFVIALLAATIGGVGCKESPHANDRTGAPQGVASATPMTESDHALRKRHMIDYGHMHDGVLYHGTISDLDGPPQATWTFELNGVKTTQSRQLSEEEFDSIWNEMVDGKVFKNSLVSDPETPVDPIANHIITVFFSDGDTEMLRNYSIPGDEDDPAFLQWLKQLRIPEGSM